MKCTSVIPLLILREAFAVRTMIHKTDAIHKPTPTTHIPGTTITTVRDQPKVKISKQILTLISSPSSGEKPAISGRKSIPLTCRAGTLHAEEKFKIGPSGGYDFVADFKAASTKGTWPAFWSRL
ncbi:uncharacterized protein RAG0_07069 [Rhynchosporium agropyri]|uniref:Uncharacterized protein n=1 Tax=Rhynchosporium agropyri TaxID=914238 RepID=A0A1E1KJS9_9HELO|nr:uncharacterized protein RAG0_07069 [Rhynchosporium agropyri]